MGGPGSCPCVSVIMDEGFMALAAEATAGVLAACARTTLSEQLDSGDGGAMGAYSSSGGGGQRAGGGAHQRRMSVTAGVQVRMHVACVLCP